MTFTHILNLKFQSRILPWAHQGWPGGVPIHFSLTVAVGGLGWRLKVWPRLGSGVVFSFARLQPRLWRVNRVEVTQTFTKVLYTGASWVTQSMKGSTDVGLSRSWDFTLWTCDVPWVSRIVLASVCLDIKYRSLSAGKFSRSLAGSYDL